MITFALPPRHPGGPQESFSGQSSLVVIGANGSGKTRFGAWIEKQIDSAAINSGRIDTSVQRLSAQRMLTLPSSIQPIPYEHAWNRLQYGTYSQGWDTQTYVRQKQSSKWRIQDGFDQPLNDFDPLLVLLLADENQRNRELAGLVVSGPPISKLHRKSKIEELLDIWGDVLPHRALRITEEKVLAAAAGAEYSGKMMSDGERVVLYLIGQSLLAKPGSVIIVDEPELHLHLAVQGLLWDRIEKARPDCVFVYLTHSLEFAATRLNARKIWISKFDGEEWSWDDLPQDVSLPEDLLLQIVGSRRPVLFVEGQVGSHDVALYTRLYPQRLVIPLGGCQRVIDAVSSVRAVPQLAHLSAAGVIDRDRRTDAEITRLRGSGIAVAEVAEVESLFCTETVVRAVAVHQMQDAEVKLADVRRAVINSMTGEVDRQTIEFLLHDVQEHLSIFGPKPRRTEATDLPGLLSSHLGGLDIHRLGADHRARLTGALDENRYPDLLRHFNHKGILPLVAKTFGMTREAYVTLVLGLVKVDPTGVLASDLRAIIGLQ